ncbi:related to acyl-CoA transferases/carnitine dehydratase [Ramularia collo-cygni]|uniref:Related to acyl-CoA transferases/carnitine dehydratase n=1 Tax=Ramularia collo-cygni TaxID=112498 RepID=A0A2D3UWZ2_9PEZI|nr:related to acyl-CoA transferases/carnitine dehydratase [Ramularia collo-cygni]CZT14614.1 related to acyl-CoA transferases/carnitine dehydratase [Ramularia collo-cygni]
MATFNYSVPNEARDVFLNGIINNKRQSGLPQEITTCAKTIKFEGSPLPSIAINWRFAESMAALKGFEAAMLNVLLGRKYGQSPLEAVINTDHCQLLFMSSSVLTINPSAHFEVNPTPIRDLSERYKDMFTLQDPFNFASSFHRRASTNIYRTSDNQFIHIHGSLNPNPTIQALGLPLEDDSVTDRETSYKPYMEVCAKETAANLESLLDGSARQACTVVKTTEQYKASPHGQANSHVNLYEVHHRPNPAQSPGWWPSTPQTGLQRPLAGLKVLDLTRVIAGPSATRGLAELGASVMRVTAKHLPDFTGLQPDLNWGKWNCFLDLRELSDREKLKQLILQADVVVDGYRPGVFDKYGFGVEGTLRLCADRERGIIYARENAYGWNGPWKHRSGWQPISDANTGISYGFGRAMGNDEPCTPVFPNSDYCTGIAGCVGVMQALIERAEKGGSYVVDFSLNYYNHWLAESCGTYPDEVWQDVWTRNGRQKFRHFHSMNVTVPAYLGMLKENASDTVLQEAFFERRRSKALLGVDFQVVRPAINFPPDTVSLGYNVGTRANGVDNAYWPDDLTVEMVE